MEWLRAHYGRDYKPNTRETIRRFTLHQFADALLIEQNPDDPGRPVTLPGGTAAAISPGGQNVLLKQMIEVNGNRR